MNKTLKTVFITITVTFVILFAVVMIFGEDTSTSNSLASDLQDGASATSNQDPAKDLEQDSPGTEVTVEMISKIINYDVFDWNGADEQGKTKIAKEIINFWAAKGNSCELTVEDLVVGIEQEIQQDPNQANVFEKACIVAQIDPQAFFEGTK